MRYSMNTGGTRLNRFLMGGLVAGSLGIALAAQPPDSRSDAGTLGSGAAQTAPYDTAPGSSSPTSGGPTFDTSMTGTVSNATGNLPPNVVPGWKIRVCSEETQVDNITFRFSNPDKADAGNKADRSGKATGKPYPSQSAAEQAQARAGTGGPAADDAGAVQRTAIWSRGSASEISLPTELREADRIRIEAIGQDDKDASVCVLYNDHVAGDLDFDDEREVATLKKTQNGECGC